MGFSKLGGLDLSRRGLDRDSRSRRQKSIKKVLDLVSMRSANTVFFSRDRDFSRQIEISVIFAYFSSISRSRSRNNEITV
jgi:hypothetical protein